VDLQEPKFPWEGQRVSPFPGEFYLFCEPLFRPRIIAIHFGNFFPVRYFPLFMAMSSASSPPGASPGAFPGAMGSGSYGPSLLELARRGNAQALSYWLTSLLGPHGIQVHARSRPQEALDIRLLFLRPLPREALQRGRSPLLRSLSYRLWTLNSPVIHEVQVGAWRQGDRRPLWQQQIRINTPANLRTRLQRASHRRRSPNPQRRLRRTLVSGVATSSLLAGYWLADMQTDAAKSTSIAPPPGSVPQPAQAFAPALTALVKPLEAPPRPSFSSADVPEAYRGQTIFDVTPPAQDKVVALTFDDGPWPETTDRILKILHQFDARATFFVTGKQVEQFPATVRQMVAAGHVVGNHSWNHPMDEVDDRTAIREVEGTNRLIQQVIGIRPVLYRPPGGNLDNRLTAYARHKGYAIAMWSVDSEDYYVAAPLIVDKVLRQVRPGGIILLHDGGGDQMTTVEALPQILTALSRQGYRFVTLPELLHLGTPQATPDTTHHSLANL